jgi:hypothetical protein
LDTKTPSRTVAEEIAAAVDEVFEVLVTDPLSPEPVQRSSTGWMVTAERSPGKGPHSAVIDCGDDVRATLATTLAANFHTTVEGVGGMRQLIAVPKLPTD